MKIDEFTQRRTSRIRLTIVSFYTRLSEVRNQLKSSRKAPTTSPVEVHTPFRTFVPPFHLLREACTNAADTVELLPYYHLNSLIRFGFQQAHQVMVAISW